MRNKNMANTRIQVYLVILIFVGYSDSEFSKKYNSPPHCTQITKDTDYVSRFKFDYPLAYLIPGQREAYQKLYCVNPALVNKAVTVVCDWSAPPQVSFTLGDDYVSIVRVDPSGRFLGNAVITTYQFCSHNNITQEHYVIVTEINN